VQKVELPDQYKPQKQNHVVYENYFRIFERLSNGLINEFDSIAALQQKNAANKKVEGRAKNH
jgi:gluconokinase